MAPGAAAIRYASPNPISASSPGLSGWEWVSTDVMQLGSVLFNGGVISIPQVSRTTVQARAFTAPSPNGILTPPTSWRSSSASPTSQLARVSSACRCPSSHPSPLEFLLYVELREGCAGASAGCNQGCTKRRCGFIDRRRTKSPR
jgi:hypothetical protein